MSAQLGQHQRKVILQVISDEPWLPLTPFHLRSQPLPHSQCLQLSKYRVVIGISYIMQRLENRVGLISCIWDKEFMFKRFDLR